MSGVALRAAKGKVVGVAGRPAYPEYKESGVEWLGEVPTDWEVKRLKYSVTCNDQVLPESTSSDYRIQYVEISSVSHDKGIENVEEFDFDQAPSRARRRVRHGDTVLSTVRTYLKAVAPIENPPDNLIVSTGFVVIRPRKIVDGKFLSYQLQSEGFIGEVVSNSVGVSYPAINPSKIMTFSGCVPSLDEQEAIAAFLDRETARIDALIAKKQRLIELLQEKRTALISQAVTKGLDPGVPMKDSGVEWLGEVPAHWEVPPLYARYVVQLGKMLDEKRITGKNLVPYLRNVDVRWDFVCIDNLPEMDIEPAQHERFTLKAGDMLVCEGGEVGRTAFWRGELALCGFQKALHRLRPCNPNRDLPRFLY